MDYHQSKLLVHAVLYCSLLAISPPWIHVFKTAFDKIVGYPGGPSRLAIALKEAKHFSMRVLMQQMKCQLVHMVLLLAVSPLLLLGATGLDCRTGRCVVSMTDPTGQMGVGLTQNVPESNSVAVRYSYRAVGPTVLERYPG